MKPRNKTERRVVELSATLPSIRQYDVDRINKDYKRVYKKGLTYYLILERCKEYQVIRYYYKNTRSLFEFMQIWLNEETKVVLAKNRWIGVDSWIRDSEMTVKDWLKPYYNYSYLGGVDRIGWSGCFIRSLLPSLKKRGLKTSTHGIHPYKLCCSLLANNRLETLFKLKQYLLVHHFGQSYYQLSDEVWQSIRVALRHGYHWDNSQEINDWCCMLHDLEFLGLDTHSPHYICPANLAEAHQHWMERVRKIRDEEERKMEMKSVEEFEDTFRANREQFYGMTFSKGNVTIQIIPTAMGIKEEGEAMHHCVGGYYNQLNSLILSAKVDGKRMETIEVNLTTYKIVQSRGLQNKSTNYHNTIVHLMKQGLPEIRKRNESHKLKIAV
jgi:hypothetical protein